MRLPTQLLYRNKDSHKGDYGHIFILGGSARFSGAAVLCAEACLRSGAGLVTIGLPKGINSSVIKIKPREVMTLPLPQTRQLGLSLSGFKDIVEFVNKIDVLVVGPGLGEEESTKKLVRKLIAKITKPVVIDADALNALVGHLNILQDNQITRKRKAILTPHPGEMARLVNRNVSFIQKNRKKIAEKFAKTNKVTLVLKGHKTVVCDYKGKVYINSTGNPGMATAGSGDCLTGIIGSFLGQGLNAFDSSKYAVYLHGLAGNLAAKEKTQIGMITSDIIDKIPEAIKLANGK